MGQARQGDPALCCTARTLAVFQLKDAGWRQWFRPIWLTVSTTLFSAKLLDESAVAAAVAVSSKLSARSLELENAGA
jgi:hypothetical protein